MRNSFHDNSALRLRYQASQRLTNEAVIPRAMLACTRRGRVSRPSIRLSTENKYNQAAFAADKRSRKAECSARTEIQTRVRSQNRNLWSAGDSPFFVDKSPSLQTEAKTARGPQRACVAALSSYLSKNPSNSAGVTVCATFVIYFAYVPMIESPWFHSSTFSVFNQNAFFAFLAIAFT